MTGNETSNEIPRRKFTGEIYEVTFIYDVEHLGQWGGVWHWTNKSNPHTPHPDSPALAPSTWLSIQIGLASLQCPCATQTHNSPTQAPPSLTSSACPGLPSPASPGFLSVFGKEAGSHLDKLVLQEESEKQECQGWPVQVKHLLQYWSSL